MKYGQRVKVKSGFHEGNEFMIIDYCKWEQADKNYKYVEVPYDMKETDGYLTPLLPEQKKYKLYDEELGRKVRGPDDGWFLESTLELI